MIALLLSLLWSHALLAEIETGVPYAWVMAVVGALCGTVGVVFKMLMDSHRSHIADMNAFWAGRFKKIDEEREADREAGKERWAIVERVTHVRLLEIAAFPHVAPQIREDAKGVLKEVESAQADLRRKDDK